MMSDNFCLCPKYSIFSSTCSSKFYSTTLTEISIYCYFDATIPAWKKQSCYHGYLWQNSKKVIKSEVNLSFSLPEKASFPRLLDTSQAPMNEQLKLLPSFLYMHAYRVEKTGEGSSTSNESQENHLWLKLSKLNTHNGILQLQELISVFASFFGG